MDQLQLRHFSLFQELSRWRERGLLAYKDHHILILDEKELETTCLEEKLF